MAKNYFSVFALILGGMLGLLACESDLAITKAEPPVEAKIASPDYNFLVRNPKGDTLSLRDTVVIEFYLRQLDKEVKTANYKFSFVANGGDGDFFIGNDTLRQNDISGSVAYSNLLPTKYRVLGRYVQYMPKKAGPTTLTFTARDGDNQTKQASLSVYFKEK